ncbi:L-lactate dehydrogenase [Saccharospirillum alexandrii]|uniref:alpha-hydroxy acid oxidase n=1 Tax=Saccharospirillum alexandrii TaxID=2448477 RepID=UPI0037352E23
MSKPCDVLDYQRLARRRVPRMFYDYADSGSWTESTYRANASDFDKLKFRQRVAVDMSDRTLETTMVGQTVSMPLALAPTGLTGLQWADGEIHAARAAEKAGVPFTLSTMSICSIEDVAAHTAKPFWFQLYVMRDRDFIGRLIDRAKAAGCSALVVTLDLQILGQRHKDIRNGLSAPPSFSLNSLLQIMARPAWAMRMLGTKRRGFGNVIGHVKGIENMTSLSEWSAKQLDPKLSWDDIAWIKERWGGPIILKGIMDPEDAKLAVKTGADAIVVSNHGGRQLDGAPSSIEVLPSILDAVGDDLEVHIDGGICTGQALLKALCLGARSTYIGRPFLYGLGAAGEAGVSDVLRILRNELDVSLALCGERDIQNVGRHNLYNPDVFSR